MKKFVFSLFCFAIIFSLVPVWPLPASTLASTDPIELSEALLAEPSIPGRTEGNGTYFEIKDSDYANVTLRSNEEICVALESIPRTISLNIEAVTDSANSTELTIEGFEPNKTLYKYEDSYKNEAVFASDEKGTYSWTQDLFQPHHIWIQEEKGTIFLPEPSGMYGTWDPATRTYTLNQDLSESVEIVEDDVTLDGDGHSIIGTGTGYGIYLYEKSGVTIENCVVKGFTYGIYLTYSDNNTLASNTVSNNRDGIILKYSSNNTLTNNAVNLNDRLGISLENCSNNTLTGNTMANNQWNFGVWGSTDEAYNNSVDTSNTVDGKPIYYIQNVTNQIYDSSTNAGMFFFISCNNVTVEDLTLSKQYYGVMFFNTHNSRIEGVTALNNGYGIFLQSSSNNTLTNNTVSNNFSGIYLIDSNYNTLTNNIVSNEAAGIWLCGYSSYNTLTKNTASNNMWGIYLFEYCNYNTLIGNTVNSNSEEGILILGWCSNNTLTNNTVSKNYYGINIVIYCDNNRIYHNNFLDNTHQARLELAYGNLFDDGYPSGGNYWSDYSGVDLYNGPNQDQPGSDGIGDTPYTFPDYTYPSPLYGQDRYPFMQESGWEAPELLVSWSCPPQANMGDNYDITLTATNPSENMQTLTFSLAETNLTPGELGDQRQWWFEGEPYNGENIQREVAPGETVELTFTLNHHWNWIPPWEITRLLDIAANIILSIPLVEAETLTITVVDTLLTYISSVREMAYLYEGTCNSQLSSFEIALSVPWEKQLMYGESVIAGVAAGKSTSAGLALLLTGVGAPAAAPFFAAEAVLYATGEVAYVLAVDPLDDYSQIAVPEPVVIAEMCEIGDPTANEIAQRAVDFLATFTAMKDSYLRYDIAEDMGSLEWMAVQYGLIQNYARDAEHIISDLEYLLGPLTDDIPILTEEQMEEARQMIAESGLPQIEECILAALGYAPEEVEQIEDALENCPDNYFVYSVDLCDTLGTIGEALDTFSITVPPLPEGAIAATIDVKPDTLNPSSKGRWITAYIELPEGHNVADIDCSTVRLQDLVQAESCGWPLEWVLGDHDEDGILDMLLKFDREAVLALAEGDYEGLAITGQLFDSTVFGGADVIGVIGMSQ